MGSFCHYLFYGDIYMKGSTIWYLQRWSSIFILLYVIYLFLSITSLSPVLYVDWMLFVSSFVFKATTSLVFLSILTHAFLGLWTIGTDYLTPRTLGFLNLTLSKIADSSRLLYNIFFTVLGLFMYLFLLFLIWI
jgi:succinate dehydrogenase / fumarate reductase membrane anchor subunit